MFASNFEQEERSFRTRKNSLALFITVSIHAIILLILFYTILQTPDPPFEDSAGGMAVNFGFDEAGSGDVQPMSYDPGPMSNTAPAAASSAPAQSAPEEQLSEEESETEVVAPKVVEKKPKPTPKPNPETTFKPQPKTNTTTTTNTKPATTTANTPPAPKAENVFTKGAYGKPNNSTGDGTGGGQGDQGKPNGDPNSKNYLGDGGFGDNPGSGGLGKGGYSLAGRKKTAIPDPVKCDTRGTVVVAIKVNREGKVVSATVNRLKSTAVDECNTANALSAARKATFNADPDAPEIQEGTITYVYQVK